MKKIAVIYYSRTGNTKAMAKILADSINETENVNAELFDVSDFKVKDMPSYDGFVIGSPTYYGGMSYEIKKLFDESVSFHGKLRGKVGVAFSSAANIAGGNETTILSIINAMLIHGMIVLGVERGDHYGPVAIGRPDERATKQCKEFAQRVAELVKKI